MECYLGAGLMIIEKIEVFNPTNESEIEERNRKCELMWQGLIEYLKKKSFYKNRVWWDNKEAQFVYGKTKDDNEPSWYLVDLDLVTSEYGVENVSVKEKYIGALGGFYKSGCISNSFYDLAKQEIENTLV